MARARSRRDNNLRRQLAYRAARLMAEDGITDFGMAKWKAAREARLEDAKLLPDNVEIEAALREYQGLYQSEGQPAHLRRMREVAVKVMRDFGEFRPVLVGSVLSGTAGAHSDVNLQLYADDAKAVPIFLLNCRYRFEEATWQVRRGEQREEVPRYRIEVDGIPITLTVFDRDAERTAPSRSASEGLQRARLADVEALLRA